MTSPTVFHPFTCIKPLPWLTGLGLALALVQSPVHAQGFEVSSPSFTADGRLTQAHVFAGFGCEGGNQSPALVWTTPPEGTQSLAITAYDPDAPHRYRFTVHALKVPRLDLPADASAALVGYMLHMNRIASTTVEARYGR